MAACALPLLLAGCAPDRNAVLDRLALSVALAIVGAVLVWIGLVLLWPDDLKGTARWCDRRDG